MTIEAEQAASLQAKLLQLASGFIYDTKIVGITSDDKVVKQKDAYRIHDLKFDALEELLDTTLEGKTSFWPITLSRPWPACRSGSAKGVWSSWMMTERRLRSGTPAR